MHASSLIEHLIQVYISTGDLVGTKVKQPQIDGIIRSIRSDLRGEHYGKALEAAVVQVGLTLSDKVDPATGQDGESSFDWGLAFFASIVAGFFGISAWTGHRRSVEQNNIRGRLRGMQNDLNVCPPSTCPCRLQLSKHLPCPFIPRKHTASRPVLPLANIGRGSRGNLPTATILATTSESMISTQAAKRGRYVATSCPVCLEDFSTSGVPADTPATDTVGDSGTAPAGINEDTPLLHPQHSPQPAPVPSAPPMPGAPGSNTVATSHTPTSAAQVSTAAAAFCSPEADVREPFMLPCGHTFCEPCITEWLKRHATCPGTPQSRPQSIPA